MKQCTVCKELKSLSDFGKLKIGKDGHNSCCKFCDRKRKLKYSYGITPEEFEIMLIEQNHKCKICKNNLIHFCRKTHVDHNHVTGKVRGILCNKCNLLIGHALDSIDILKSAIKYLK